MENKIATNDAIDTSEKIIKTRPRKSREEFIEKECEVIYYNSHEKTLDIKFNKYGIRVRNVELIDNKDHTTIKIKYKGEIGKPNFIIKV